MARTPSPVSTLSNPFAARPPKHARHAKPQAEAPKPQIPVDSTPSTAVQSGFSVFNPTPVKETMMSTADAEKATSKALDAEAKAAAKAQREADKAAKVKAAEDAKAAKIAEREAKAAAKEADKLAKAEARAAAKAEREARLAELGPQSKMSALRDAKKNYVKSATGQLRATDDLATALDAVPPHKVVPLAIELLQLPENPYGRLNVGQQSMNLRNKLRGAIRRNVLTIDQIVTARDAGGYALTAEELAARAPKPRAAKAEAAAAA